MMQQDSLEPAAIRFTLERLQESARRSGYLFSCIFKVSRTINQYTTCMQWPDKVIFDTGHYSG